MRGKILFLLITLCCILCFATSDSFATEVNKKNKYNLLNLKDDSSVYAELTPYLWFGGFNGHLSANETSPLLGVDVKFNDLVDSIEVNIPVSASIKKGKWGWYTDFFFLSLKILITNISVKL